MSEQLPVDPDARLDAQARALLRIGHEQRPQWWTYESENNGSYMDRWGRVYEGVTYTLMLPDGGDERVRERVLHLDEVRGYVLGAADVRGEAWRVAFRVSLLPPGKSTRPGT
jgi:hypothetical protein